MYALFFTTSQMKSLHYDQCFRYIYIHTYICVVSSRRNKTNPYHRNKIIPVLYATQLQACKPKLSTYDQLLTTNQQAVSLNRCVRKLKHFQPHSLLCQLWCESFQCNWFVWKCDLIYDDTLYTYVKSTKQLRQPDKFVVSHHTQFISHC